MVRISGENIGLETNSFKYLVKNRPARRFGNTNKQFDNCLPYRVSNSFVTSFKNEDIYIEDVCLNFNSDAINRVSTNKSFDFLYLL